MKYIDIFLDKRGYLVISGNVVFENALSVYKKMVQLTCSLSEINIDFINLKNVDSSIIVILISFIREIKFRNSCVFFYNVPFFLFNLSKIYDLDGIFF